MARDISEMQKKMARVRRRICHQPTLLKFRCDGVEPLKILGGTNPVETETNEGKRQRKIRPFYWFNFGKHVSSFYVVFV